MKIRDFPKVERPRERLEKYGANKLSDSELLAIVLGTGTKGANVVELSTSLLKRFSGKGLASASVKDLKEVFGLGAAKSCEIVAMFELGRRLLKDKKSALLLGPEDVWNELKDIRDHKKEHFVVFFLDAMSQEIRRETISVGILNANLIHPREVFEPAIERHAAAVMLAHNHPSGDPEPSEADRLVTEQLVQAGRILGIEVLDHVIVAKGGYVSLKERGYMA